MRAATVTLTAKITTFLTIMGTNHVPPILVNQRRYNEVDFYHVSLKWFNRRNS